MDVFVFSDNTKLRKTIESLPASKGFPVTCLPMEDIKKAIKSLKHPVIAYVDCMGIDHELYTHIRFLSKNTNTYFGVIDMKKSVYDVSDLFFLGAVDYIGGMDLTEEFNDRRFKSVLQYIKKFRTDSQAAERTTATTTGRAAAYKIANSGWDEIVSGKEYTFQIMYIELDGAKEIEKKYTKKHLEDALNAFYNYINRYVTNFQGKIWIWKDMGGIILFPFNGKESRAVTVGFVTYLYKCFHDVEESKFPQNVSFRMAIHLGNVVYVKKETGNVISDTINSVVHVGKKFAKPGCFYITEDIHRYIPPQLTRFFVSEGKYEGRTIYRMRQLTSVRS